MKRVLVLDDDLTVLTLIKRIFNKEEYIVDTFTSGSEALEEIKKNSYDLIISDLIMPEMKGDTFFRQVKENLPDIPFIFLTSSKGLDTVVGIMKMGADDYILKPINPKKVIERVSSVLEENKTAQFINETIIDDLIDKREKSRLFSWKDLYGMKEIEQTNKIMTFLSRNIDQAGGFLWLEILKGKISEVDPDIDDIPLSRTMLKLIIESTEYISKIIDDLKYVTSLQSETILLENIKLSKFLSDLKNLYEEELITIAVKNNKRISFDHVKDCSDYYIEINMSCIRKIMHELLYNAIKYSPKDSKIMIHFDIKEKSNNSLLEVSYWNTPVVTVPEDSNGYSIIGIPYEYSENVFDLFYTMEKLPVRMEEEEWSQGTGLYIVRKMLQKMNGEISAQNVIMHKYYEKTPFVKITVLFPLY